MPGIFPNVGNGALIVRDIGGMCTGIPGALNTYCPPAEFVTSCQITALPEDCTARIAPSQINAIASELLCLAEAFSPEGPWDCASTCNLATLFEAWAAGVAANQGNADGVTISGNGSIATPFEIIPLGVANAICADEPAIDALTECVTDTICATDAIAAQLSACLLSTDADNAIRQGSDGLLYTNLIESFADAPLVTSISQNDEVFFINFLTGEVERISKANFDIVNAALLKWRGKAIGEVYYVDTSKPGVDIPPSNLADTVWIQLTAGLTGAGQFNEGKLSGESVSGTAPLVIATANVAYAPSPMLGASVDLLNTEARILRPGLVAGTKVADAMQGHWHTEGYSAINGGYFATGGANMVKNNTATNNTLINQGGVRDPFTDGTNGTPRVANETRMKHKVVTAYMRIA